MNERDDDTNLSPEESISDEIGERVRSVISAAESAATAIRHEAEQQAQLQRRAAEGERQRFLEQAKAEAEALLEERMKRISELSDSLIEGAEKILMRMEGAQEVKRQLDTMVKALASAAEELAGESSVPRDVPRPRPVAVEDEQPRMRAVPEPEETAVVTELRVPQPEPEPEVEAAAPEPEVVEPVVVDEAPGSEADSSEVEVVDAVAVEDEPDTRQQHNGAVEDVERPVESRGFDGDDMLAARLVALQMAVAGSARVEVEEHLRKTFALEEPGSILNDVFGAESKL
jgi:F0F1-type ATP synthase membrane subunit b/b'